MKSLPIFFLLLLSACINAQTQRETEQRYADYPWQFTTPMPHGRYGHDAIYASNGNIYVMGGLVYKVVKGFTNGKGQKGWIIDHYNDGRYSNLTFDPIKNQWEYMTSIPGTEYGNHVMLYYPDEDKWIEKQVAITKLTNEAKIKLCQPLDNNKKPARIYGANFIRQGNGVAITTLQNNIVLWVGGGDFLNDGTNIALPYQLKEDTWPGLIRKEYEFESGRRKTIYETDQREMFQTTVPPMQESRRDHRAVTTSDGKIYVLGGWRREKTGVNLEKGTYNKMVNVVSKTMECYDPEPNRWEYKKPLSCERMSFAAVAGNDNKIYIFGGAAGMETEPKTLILNTVEVYDPETDSWSFRKSMPVKRSGHCAVLAADGKIYVLGGSEVPDLPLNTVYIYDPEKDIWEKGPDMILPRDVFAAVSTPDGKIYAIGGTDVNAYKNKALWKHLAELVPNDELGDYTGKVQDTVEVLDIYKWRKSKEKK
jgi:hypothetical protein